MPVLHVSPIKTGMIADKLYAVDADTVNFFVYKCGDIIISFDSGFGKKRISSELKSIGDIRRTMGKQ